MVNFSLMQEEDKSINTDNPAIIIIAYDRDKSLSRLLNSLDKAHFSLSNVPLIISIDQNSNHAVYSIAENFQWSYGTKEIIVHQQHLGLKEHVLSCGNLILKLDAAILLEDDLIVAPYFYNYAILAQQFYEKDKAIAGISLYSYAVAESCFLPFHANDDGFHNYFMQVPSSWGQLWTAEQWRKFIHWKDSFTNDTAKALPNYVKEWGSNSWKKDFFQYLIDKELYFVFPRKSHTTNFEDRGTHAKTKDLFQVELQNYNQEYRFSNRQQSTAQYDSSFEIKAEIVKQLCPALSAYDFSTNLYGTKNKTDLKTYTLSTQKGNNPILSFGSELFPPLQNIIYNTIGEQIHLTESAQLKEERINKNIFYPASNFNKNPEVDLISIGLQIGIVIPLLIWNEEALLELIFSIQNQTYTKWKCLIIVKQDESKQIEEILRRNQCSNQIELSSTHATELSTMIELGFNQIEGDLLCYYTPKIILASSHLEQINSAFTQFHSVKWLKTFDIKSKLLDYRWNKETLYHRIVQQKMKTSIEGMVFSKYIWTDLGKKFNDNLKELKEE
ncbi:MAG: glycosyltransferase family 2 protein, partial [Flavobacteriales bacterium]|nr:glycosyltransferase family 2 protein [Flavobacteriales bacterium]